MCLSQNTYSVQTLMCHVVLKFVKAENLMSRYSLESCADHIGG
jgi:hypothetical protein